MHKIISSQYQFTVAKLIIWYLDILLSDERVSELLFFPVMLQDSIPRQLHLNITRTGGMVGGVGINITVTYHLPGSSIPSNEVTLDYNGDVTIAAGSRSTSVVVRIADNGFIKLGAAFEAELIAVRLQSGGIDCTLFILRSWGPFLESPGNFSGPKSNIQIEI